MAAFYAGMNACSTLRLLEFVIPSAARGKNPRARIEGSRFSSNRQLATSNWFSPMDPLVTTTIVAAQHAYDLAGRAQDVGLQQKISEIYDLVLILDRQLGALEEENRT